MKNELKIGARVRVSLYDVVTMIWHGDARNSDLFRRKEKLIFGTVEFVAGEFVAVRLDDGRAVAFLPESLEVVPAEAGVPAADVSERGGAKAAADGGCLHNVIRRGRCVRCGRVVIPRECRTCGTRTTEGGFVKGNWTCGTCVPEAIRKSYPLRRKWASDVS